MYRSVFTASFIMLSIFAIVAAADHDRNAHRFNIVGSSTVYPFSKLVAKKMGELTEFATPNVRSTGSGGGFKLFCAGIGSEHPDITNASRAIKQKEKDLCQKNNIGEVTEIKAGYDGIVLAKSSKADDLNLTRRQIFLALAKEIPADETGETLIPNPHKTWQDVDASLPNDPILFVGPPLTSGTRDAFHELAMEKGCQTFSALKALKSSDKTAYKATCTTIRKDGPYVEAGENDKLIIRRLNREKSTIGILGYSYIAAAKDKLKAVTVENNQPTFENIASGYYPLSRPLFFYVKNARISENPAILKYTQLFTSEETWGPNGYLKDAGLIPLPYEERSKYQEIVKKLAQ